MHTRSRVLGFLALVLLCGAALGSSDRRSSPRQPGPRAIEPLQADDRSFSFRLTTPEPSLELGADGFSDVKIEGFPARGRRTGAPDLPTKTVLVAIPEGATPRLEVRTLGAQGRAALPRPVAQTISDVTPDDVDALARPDLAEPDRIEILRRTARNVHRPDRGIYEHSGFYPERVAWLGNTGVLRDQRYVEVHLAPVRFDGETRGLEVSSGLEITVHFDGDVSGNDARASDSPFESVYRNAFVNYNQGRSFRLGIGTRQPGHLGTREPVRERMAPSTTSGATILLYKIRVSQNGPVRLDHALLQTTGFLVHPISTWKLMNRGVQVALQVNDNGNDLLELGEWVQFYGQALDDEPKTALSNDEPTPDPDLFELRDFSDVNVYFLEVVPQAQPPMTTRNATSTFTRTPPPHFLARAHAEQDSDSGWRPLGGADPWYWIPSLFANNFASNGHTRTNLVPLPGLYSGTEPARVLVNVRGLSPYIFYDKDEHPDWNDHPTEVVLKDASGQALDSFSGFFQDRSVYLHDFTWTYPGSGSGLTSPAQVQLTAEQIAGGSMPNDLILDYIEIHYRRSFTALGNELTFEWQDEDAEFIVSDLSSPAADVYEITLGPGERVVETVRLTGASVTGSGPYSIRFRVDDQGLAGNPLRRFVVFGGSAAHVPSTSDLESDTVSDLRQNSNQADLIVIADPSTLDLGPGACTGAVPTGCLTELLDFRASPAGGDLSWKVVLLEDVQDEFNYGLAGPQAIKEFLRWVLSTAQDEGWAAEKPAYVLLLGDGTYKYKTGAGNVVPTQILFQDLLQLGYYSSDNTLAAVVGPDHMPDIVIGRMPARNTAEANLMLQKTLDYEQAAPTGPWRERLLFVSDRGKGGNNPGEALEFEGVNDFSAAYIDEPPYVSRQIRYWSDYYSDCFYDPGLPQCCGFITFDTSPICIWNQMRSAIKGAVNGTDGGDGAAVVQYMGHGGFTVWSDDAFFDNRPEQPPVDTNDLSNGLRLPWLMAHNCLTGAFHSDQSNTMAEDWLKRDGGGAVVAFSPSGPSFNFIGSLVTAEVWDNMFGPRREREVGFLVLDALAALCTDSIESCQNYVLLGDPALRLALRSTAPPTNVTATGGNAQVTLTWTASATPGATYDVYRSTFVQTAVPQYTKMSTTGPISGTTFTNSCQIAGGGACVSNAQRYYYYVVAVEGGFESRWSHFNSDCHAQDPDLSGPDCLEALPLNPNPPSTPTGLQVVDPGLGDRLRLTWTANPEGAAPQGEIDYYTAHYGTQSGNYTGSIALGRGTSGWVTGLTPDVTYYFALTATNTSGHTSGLSAEVNDFPVVAPGLRPPRTIANLKVRAQGNDLVLEWGAVTTNVYNEPTQIVSYEVLRRTPPPYASSGLTVIGTCPGPSCSTATSFTDPGARVAPGNYIYAVRAVDAQGNRGGLGSDVPDGTLTLRVGPSATPGNVVLSWNPILTTVTGDPLSLQHYLVYQSSLPFTHSAIRDGQLPDAPTIVQGTSADLPAPAVKRYYSVVAVDVRGNGSPY